MTNDNIEIKAVTVEISKLELGPDDLLLVRVPNTLKNEQVSLMATQLREAIPDGIEILITYQDVSFQKISKTFLDGPISICRESEAAQ